MNQSAQAITRGIRRAFIAVVGITLLVLGLALLALPGPGLLVVIAGLAVLATEFAWARRRLDQAKAAAKTANEKAKGAIPGRRKQRSNR